MVDREYRTLLYDQDMTTMAGQSPSSQTKQFFETFVNSHVLNYSRTFTAEVWYRHARTGKWH